MARRTRSISNDAQEGVKQAVEQSDNRENIGLLTPFYTDTVDYFIQIEDENLLYLFDKNGNDEMIDTRDENMKETIDRVNNFVKGYK